MEIFTGLGKSVKWKSTSARGQVAERGRATWKTTQRRFPRPFEIGLIKTHRLLIRTLSLFVILKTNSIIPAGSPNFFFFFFFPFSPLFAAGRIPSRPCCGSAQEGKLTWETGGPGPLCKIISHRNRYRRSWGNFWNIIFNTSSISASSLYFICLVNYPFIWLSEASFPTIAHHRLCNVKKKKTFFFLSDP